MERLREQMTRQVFGPEAPIKVFSIPFPRNKLHGLYLKAMIPSTQTVSEQHLQAPRDFLRRMFAIAPIDKFPPDALIM